MRTIEEFLDDARTVANMPLHRAAFVPSQQDKAAILKKTTKLRKLEKALSIKVTQLLRDQDAIRAQIALHDALIAPCRRLPPEILSDIFVLALPEHWDDQYAGKRSLNFARVCLYWREVALLTPRLWTSLRFDAMRNPLAKHVNALKAELAKTAQAPLSLFITMRVNPLAWLPAVPPMKEDLWSRKAWSLLCAESHRWERALLEQLPGFAYDDVAGRAFPLMQDLALYINEEDDEVAYETVPLTAFKDAPNLRSLFIHYTSPVQPFRLPQTWSLTKLIIQCGDHADVTLAPCLNAIMACASTLRSCIISADESFGDFPAGREPTTFPHLEDLELRHNAIFLGHLMTIPSIKSLRVSAYPDVETYPFDALKSMLARSAGCNSCHFLMLDGLEPTSADDVVSCLQLVPHLTDLELKHDEAIEDIEHPLITLHLLLALSRDSGRAGALTLLPDLTRLVVNFGGLRSGTYDPDMRDALAELLRSRRSAREVNGVKLAALQQLRTGDRSLSWPPEELEDFETDEEYTDEDDFSDFGSEP
ncbi:hypothetical protein EV121DRAFT_274978 [Schizophyllum commune]